MRIKVINPNTSQPMTTLIERTAQAVAGLGTSVLAVSPAMGPASVESHYDEALSVPGIITEIVTGEQDGVDGYVIACFGDPGLDAARELANGPVVGIAEAAMRAAMFLGRGFSVVTTLERTRGRAFDLADRYGAARACLGVHACGISVLDLDTDPDVVRKVTAACCAAIEQDGSDAVVLGCAGMADLCAEVSAATGVPVIDGVRAATLMVQSLVAMGLRSAGRGEYATPAPKHYSGLLRDFGH